MMYLKNFCSALLLAAVTIGYSFNSTANDRQYYETRICMGCDYNYAMATAAEIKPAINCTGSDDPFNSGTAQAQQCFATPIKILVVDANSRNIWHFENTYANQGQPLYNLTNEVNYQPLVPASAIQLANQLLDIYEKMDALAVEYANRLNAGEFDYITDATSGANLIQSTQTQTDPCQAYEYSEALKAAFGPKLRDFIQLSMQEDIRNTPSLLGGLWESKLLNTSFNIGNSVTSLGGTWKISRNAEHITRIYGAGTLNNRTQVTYTSSMTNNGLELTLNDVQTYFDGMSLKNLKSQTYSSAQINECLAKALDAAYPKTVAGSGSSSVGYGNIALINGGSGHGLPSGTSGGTTTCKHTYYINGIEMMSFEGACP